VEVTKSLVVMVANGQRMITDTHCAALSFSLQGHAFKGDLCLLQIQGYDVILGLDWMSQFSTMLVNWEDKWVELKKEDATVRLQVREEKANVHMYETIQVAKGLKGGNEMLVAHIWLCEAADLTMDLSKVPKELHPIVYQYASLFDSKPKLPPARDIDHRIPLLPATKPINLRLYRYSYFQKLEFEKVVAEMLNLSIIRPSTSPFSSPTLLVKKKMEPGNCALIIAN
jgi:Retroviral aspartyl protease